MRVTTSLPTGLYSVTKFYALPLRFRTVRCVGEYVVGLPGGGSGSGGGGVVGLGGQEDLRQQPMCDEFSALRVEKLSYHAV